MVDYRTREKAGSEITEGRGRGRGRDLREEAGVRLVADGLVEDVDGVVRGAAAGERLRGEDTRVPEKHT